MPTLTSAQMFVKLPQFVVEATEGTTPTASPTFITCGSATSLDTNKNNAANRIGQVGTEDALDIASGPFSYSASMQTQLINHTWLQRFINAVNWATPTDTIAESVSILYSQYIGGITEKFTLIKGARPKSVTIELPAPGPIIARTELEAMDIIEPTTSHGLTTPTFASNPSGSVFVDTDGTFSWNAIALKPKSISVTLDRGTTADLALGSNTPIGTLPHARRITGSFTNLYTQGEATTLEADWIAGTKRNIVWAFDTGVSTLTITNAKLTRYSRTHSADDTQALVESCEFEAETAAVA